MVLVPNTSNFYEMKNVATGRCLDSNEQGNVYAIACNGGPYQKWIVTLRTNGRRSISNRATGRLLDSNAQGNVYTLPSNLSRYQLWY